MCGFVLVSFIICQKPSFIALHQANVSLRTELFLVNQEMLVLPDSRRAEKPAITDRAGVRLGGVAGSREHDPPALLLGRTPHPCSLQRSLA